MNTLSGVFEWSIDNFWEARRGKRSPVFDMCGNACSLYISVSVHSNIYGLEERIAYYDFSLFKSVVFDPGLHRVTYRISVVDRYRQEVIIVNGNLQDIVHHLMTLSEFYLKAHEVDVLPGGSLTLRFSWSEGTHSSVRTQTESALFIENVPKVFNQETQTVAKQIPANILNQGTQTAEVTNKCHLSRDYGSKKCVDDVKDGHEDCLIEENTKSFLEQIVQAEASAAENTKSFLEEAVQTEASAAEVVPSMLLEILSNDFEKFHEVMAHPDCVLRSESVEMPAHRAVLSARSPVFSAMFSHNTMESTSGEATIQDVDSSTLKDVLHYVYTGKVRGLKADTAAVMYTTADEYALLGLKEACLEFLLRNLTTENIYDAIILAHTHGEEALEKEAIRFVENRLGDIQDSAEWNRLLDEKPVLANKILSSAVISLRARVRPTYNMHTSVP